MKYALALLAVCALTATAHAQDNTSTNALDQLKGMESTSNIAASPEAGESTESSKEWSNRGTDRDQAPESAVIDDNLQPQPLSVSPNSDSGSDSSSTD